MGPISQDRNLRPREVGYLTGNLIAPKSTDSSYTTWMAENSIVLAWLIYSMETNISRRYLWFQTAKEVWDGPKKMYSDLGNSSQIFELRFRLKELKQGQHSVTQYFSEIQDIWQELDLFINETPSCAECAVKLRSIIEKERVFDFLAGLNRNLDDVRWHLVARDSFPYPEDAFAEVRREEMRRKVMLVDESILSQSDTSALVSNKVLPTDQHAFKRPWCDHCHRPGHTKDKCWEIHGKPANWQPRKKQNGRAHQA